MLGDNFLIDRYKNVELLCGSKDADKEPSIIQFRNADLAASLLDKHLYDDKSILIHVDVDFDGIGCTYEMSSFIKCRNSTKDVKMCINKEKEHGISESVVRYVNNKNPGLFIVVDSSSNDIDLVKKINCDVLVIDHHKVRVDASELMGETANGKYVIISSMVSGPEYLATTTMSCGLVIYEFLRYYQSVRGLPDEIKQNKLYQWAVCTLFTDVIDTDTERNLYYINKTFTTDHIEKNLKIMLNKLMRGYGKLNKTSIGFNLAPSFNRAIRAGYSSLALSIAVNFPERIGELNQFKTYQRDLISGVEKYANEYTGYAYINTSNLDISKNYNGLIATTLLDKFKKSSIAYKVYGGIAKGSFRGLKHSIDYNKIICDLGFTAEGHETAFGFQIPITELNTVMNKIADIESETKTSEYLVSPLCKCNYKHKIDNMSEFTGAGNIWKIGVLNSKISGGTGNLDIILSLDEIQLDVDYGNYLEYKCYGMTCKAFERIVSPNVTLYIEYGDKLNLYLRNKWDKNL